MAQLTKTKGASFSPDWRFQDPVAWRDTELDEKTLIEWFHYMLLGRQIDYRFQVLNRQGRAPFIISVAGHEAAQILVAFSRFTEDGQQPISFTRAPLAWQHFGGPRRRAKTLGPG